MYQDAKNLLHAFEADESGATAIEYGIIAVGISVVIVAVVTTIGSDIKTTLFEKVATGLKTQ